jgi:hypothetical protein
MVAYNPDERPSLEDILNHPSITEDYPQDEEIKQEFERRLQIVYESNEEERKTS